MSHYHCSWSEYHDLCEKLVAKVAKSGWQFDSLLCLARGGMRPGDIFSRVYDIPLAVLSTSSYRDDAGKVQGALDISRHITGCSELKGRVLLVDDLCDSGKTIKEVRTKLLEGHPAITDIKVAVLWVKACSVYEPDFYVMKFEDSPWIHQPFEEYDDIGAKALLDRCAEKFGADGY